MGQPTLLGEVTRQLHPMSFVTYNVPAHLVPKYRGRQIVVRLTDLAEIADNLAGQDLNDVQYVQLLTAGGEVESLAGLANAQVPLDIVLTDPASEFPILYNFAKLRDRHVLRVTIPVKPGFAKAVKLAASLHFAVKLDVGQPDSEQIAELAEVLDLYLHRSGVSQPVEFFHTLFLSRFEQKPASLWSIQEEDPEYFCFVGDDGREMLSMRFAGVDPVNATGETTGTENLKNSAHECDTCEFLGTCRGYFKWPDSSYDCVGVKSLFKTIDSAAAQLGEDVLAAAATQGGTQR